MNSQNNINALHPTIRVQTSIPISAPPACPLTPTSRTADFSACGVELADSDWPMYTSMGGPIVSHLQELERARSHQRTPSASTVASNGPASPATSNYSNPQIANTDFSPHSPVHCADQAGATFSKTPVDAAFLNSSRIQAAHMGGAHQAMKDFVIDHHNGEDSAPGFGGNSSSQSMSSYNHDPPSTPQSGASETAQNGCKSSQQNVTNPNVQLYRTESEAFQDELYNPLLNTAPTSASKTSNNNLLTPHRNLVTERLQTANIARSQSPSSSVSRERSPFRDGSPLAPASGWQSPAPALGTAAGLRQQQKEQADQLELAQHRPQLQREPTKTISPKDALLDYNEPEQPSLFHDAIPAGYKQHTGGTEQWLNNFFSQPGSAFGTLQTPSRNAITNFRATPSSADGYSGRDMNFQPLPPTSQVQNVSYLGGNSYAAPPPMEANPEFPAHLTNMESSMSDNPPASQESAVNNETVSAPQRPTDTHAGTGTYTCTYHGCTKRFDSHANLQRHKRDLHRSQQHNRDTSGTSGAALSGTASTSPRSTESPTPHGSGVTSAALAARDSQAAPHKCMRINPSTNKPCNTIFSRPYDLTRHEDTIHNNRKAKFRCPMCHEEKTFSRNDALTRHMRVVHPEVESFGKRQRRGDRADS